MIDRTVPPPTVPTFKGPPCATCKVPMAVDFQLANCRNPNCGRYTLCSCAKRGQPSDPYTMHTQQWYGALVPKEGLFCRTCGDQLQALP